MLCLTGERKTGKGSVFGLLVEVLAVNWITEVPFRWAVDYCEPFRAAGRFTISMIIVRFRRSCASRTFAYLMANNGMNTNAPIRVIRACGLSTTPVQLVDCRCGGDAFVVMFSCISKNSIVWFIFRQGK